MPSVLSLPFVTRIDRLRLPALLLLYFGLHVLSRSLVSHNLQLDEAEQVVLAQDWLWGYGSQPPLYTWIQKIVFASFGVSVFSLSFVKNFFLLTIYLLTWLCAKLVFDDSKLADLSTASMFFLPHLAWESQRDQTHLVLATACAAATLFAWLKSLRSQQRRWFVAFGITAGLGVLAKYNFSIFPVALIISSFCSSPLRPQISAQRLFLALAALVLIVAPHAFWAFQNQPLLTSQAHKFEISAGSPLLTVFTTLGQFCKASLAFVAAPLSIFAMLYLPVVRRSGSFTSPLRSNVFLKLVLTTMLVSLAIVLVLSLGFHVTRIRDRWLQTVLFPLPLLLVGLVSRFLNRQKARIIFILASIVAVTVLFAINGTVLFAGLLRRPHNLRFPFAAVAAHIRAVGFQRDVILTDDFFLAGNLKMHFPVSRVVVPQHSSQPLHHAPNLLIWRASGTNIPSSFPVQASDVPHFINVPCHNGPRRSEHIALIFRLQSNSRGPDQRRARPIFYPRAILVPNSYWTSASRRQNLLTHISQ